MAQKDRYKERVINIDFLTKKHLNDFPIAKQYALICITHGSATGTLNNQAVSLKAPCFLCLNPQDYLSFTQNKLALQAFCFDEEFLKTAPYVPTTEEISESLHLSVGLSLFHQDTRTFFVSKERMNQLRGWMFIMGSEVYAQSDELWICRIKTYLIQILSMLEKIHLETKDTPLDRALCYIYEHYYEDLSLDDLTRQAHLNRVSSISFSKKPFRVPRSNILIFIASRLLNKCLFIPA